MVFPVGVHPPLVTRVIATMLVPACDAAAVAAHPARILCGMLPIPGGKGAETVYFLRCVSQEIRTFWVPDVTEAQAVPRSLRVSNH